MNATRFAGRYRRAVRPTLILVAALDLAGCGRSRLDRPWGETDGGSALPDLAHTDGGNDGAPSDGAPDARCGPGRVACGAACIDPARDSDHCGATAGCGAAGGLAGVACRRHEFCADGACARCASLFAATSSMVDNASVSGPSAIAAADLDQDGKADLIFADAFPGDPDGTHSLGVALAGPGATFQPQRRFLVAGAPGPIAVADLDGDGRADVVVGDTGASLPPSSVSLFFSSGDGTLGPEVRLSGSSLDDPIAFPDLDGDGRPDLVAGSDVWLTRGYRTLAPAPSLATAVNVAADLDGDGKGDLVSLCMGGGRALLGNGDGTFRPGPATGLPTSCDSGRCVAAADLDGDRRTDIVTSSKVYLGNGDGTFREGVSLDFGCDIVIADVDGDGHPDIAGADDTPSRRAYTTNPQLRVLFGAGDGTFAQQRPLLVGPAGGRSASPSARRPLVAGDVDGDGVTDLVTSNALSADVSVVRGAPDRRLPSGTALPELEDALAAAGGDMNGDGAMDLVAVTSQSDTERVLQVALGRNDGTFRILAPAPLPAPSAAITSLLLADLTGDGKLDVLAYGPAAAWVLPGAGDGTTGDAVAISDWNGDLMTAAAGDLDGDGQNDLVLGFNPSSRARPIGALGVMRGQGGGAFLPLVQYPVGEDPNAVVIADLDGDGASDLIVSSGGSEEVMWLPGAGDGTFGASALAYYLPGETPSTVRAADVDGDGLMDLAFFGASNGPIPWVLDVAFGIGSGVVDGLPVRVPVPFPSSLQSGRSLWLGDLDGDGLVDAVAGLPGAVVVVYGRPGRGFAPAQRFSMGSSSSGDIAVADFDRDGLLDIAGGGAILFNRLAPECGSDTR